MLYAPQISGAVFGAIISLIINPQKKQIAAYYNSVFTPIDMELLVRNEEELHDFNRIKEVPCEVAKSNKQ